MKPSIAAGYLRRIATGIESSKNPSSKLVTKDLQGFLAKLAAGDYVPDTERDPKTERDVPYTEDEGDPETTKAEAPKSKAKESEVSPSGTKVSPKAPGKKVEVTRFEGEIEGTHEGKYFTCKVDWDPKEEIPDVTRVKGTPPDPEDLARLISIKTSGIRPAKLSSALKRIASKIEVSSSPSIELVSRDLRRLLMALEEVPETERDPIKPKFIDRFQITNIEGEVIGKDLETNDYFTSEIDWRPGGIPDITPKPGEVAPDPEELERKFLVKASYDCDEY